MNLNDVSAMYTPIDSVETYESIIDHLYWLKDLVVRRVDKNFNPEPSEATEVTTLFVVSVCKMQIAKKMVELC